MFSRLDEIISKYKDYAYVRVVVLKFYIDFHEEKAFINYLTENCFEDDRIRKFTHNMFILISFLLFKHFLF